MYRRRKPTREAITFSFDSFLDVVANVIGIIVRLILVAWVGARSYAPAMQQAEPPTKAVQELSAPKSADDPVTDELEALRRRLADARLRLLDQLGNLELTEQQAGASQDELSALQAKHRELDEQAKRLSAELAGKGILAQHTVASAAELKKRAGDILKQIKALEAQPPKTHLLRYHTPVSRAVHADEMFFECRRGRVTYIDLPAFLQEIRARLGDHADALKTQWQVAANTSPSGAFRLRFTVEREKGALDSGIPNGGNFRYGLAEWTVEPLSEDRGEPIAVALKPGSEFRRMVDRIDPQITVVTFWVYEDSFELFRKLRDHLYERDIEVAGRPLIMGAPIAAPRHGTASRGQ